MATSNLLATSTSNLKQLLGNGRMYQVPPYQRDYSWKEEHWEDLWLDLTELAVSGSSQHYMGALVLKEEDHPEHFTIIDGQQRFATLSILILAVIERIQKLAENGEDPDANNERAEILRSAFVGAKDPGSLLESSKLRLNANDDDFYQGTLVQLGRPASERALSDSEKQLWGAFKYYRRKLEEEFADQSGQALADWINQLVSVRLLFIQVAVESEVSAYTVFETLNARGLELTASDLIKNYLMSLVAKKGKGDLRHVLTRWQRITGYVGARRLPEFLRHHFNSTSPFVRQERLFRRIREQVRSPENAIDLIGELESGSVAYRALAAPEDEFWLDYEGAAEHIRALVLFNVSQYKPLALAALAQLVPREAVNVLRDCVTLSFRFNVVSRLGTHELEKRYNEAALSIENREATTAREVRERLVTVYVDDDQLRADFEVFRQATSTKGKRLLRYIFCELERQRSGQDLSWQTTTATIEHILPENLTTHWEAAFSEEEHARYVDRLGNYTLLERGKNKDLAQDVFDAKKPVLQSSQYGLTQEVANFNAWDPATVVERQKALARLATSVWRFP